MATFKDNNGREWLVVVNYSSIERAQSVSGVNICEVLTGELFDRLLWDNLLLTKVLWGLCKPEADQSGISQEAFLEAIRGDPLDQGRDAIWEGCSSGFFSRSQRLALSNMREMQRANEAAQSEMATSLSSAKTNLSETTSSDSETTSPESSESTKEG